ncbi:hypothetical protein ACFQNE_08535 [Gordonia phosphorivorans]|uniref:Uncharacterized protein n=1 Tax=Gordonia phosphorivorans TaxID=1056982 RepID=A0ABV6H8A0_9ACTN
MNTEMEQVELSVLLDRPTYHQLVDVEGHVRVVPLVLAVPEAGRKSDPLSCRFIVGEVVVVAHESGIDYRVWRGHAWELDSAGIGPDTGIDPDGDLADLTGLESAVAALLPKRRENEDLSFTVARHAKAIAEASRNTAARLREFRYHWENALAEESEGSATERHTSIVASILKLHIIGGRAFDIAETAVREGLYVYLDDSDAYSAYRRLRNPNLLVDVESATPRTRPWMRLHDAAVRQCENLALTMRRESEALMNLLNGASSTAESREADAQTRLNQLVALLSIGLGVPALVLALYGAQVLLPLENWRQWVAFAPVALSLLVAAVLAIIRAPAGKTSSLWKIAGWAVIAILVALIIGAVAVVPHSMSPV